MRANDMLYHSFIADGFAQDKIQSCGKTYLSPDDVLHLMDMAVLEDRKDERNREFIRISAKIREEKQYDLRSDIPNPYDLAKYGGRRRKEE